MYTHLVDSKHRVLGGTYVGRKQTAIIEYARAGSERRERFGGIDPGSRGYPHRTQFPRGLHEGLAVRNSTGDGGGPAKGRADDGVPAGALTTRSGEPSGGADGRNVLADAARIRDGLALKNIKVPGEDMAATVRSSQPFEAVEPFERLNKPREATIS